MLVTALLLVVGLGRKPADACVLNWGIEGLGDPQHSTIVVTVWPTAFGYARGVTVRSITLEPIPTREEPRFARDFDPSRSNRGPERGVRAVFERQRGRFHVFVTFADGSTHTIDPWAPAPPSSEPKIYEVHPLQWIAPRVVGE